MKKAKLILLRHGESVWNNRNIFTGWVDVPLSEKGIEEARRAGGEIKDIPIDVVFTSTLIRAHMTTCLALLNHFSKKVPVFMHAGEAREEAWGQIYSESCKKETLMVHKSWHLNERMYGELQGLNKDETRKEFGEEKVHQWRRSFDIAPPKGESLKLTSERTVPYFKEAILPHLEKGETVLISAHGNSLRSIVMYLESLSPEEVVSLEIATGDPIIYTYDKKNWIKEKNDV